LEKQNKLITLTEAAHILGYKSYRSIRKLIDDGLIKTYTLPNTSRKRVRLQDVMGLAVPEIESDSAIDS
jgi:hypothetical protein